MLEHELGVDEHCKSNYLLLHPNEIIIESMNEP